jgi:Spy/CpxP family protein refolding chaperone
MSARGSRVASLMPLILGALLASSTVAVAQVDTGAGARPRAGRVGGGRGGRGAARGAAAGGAVNPRQQALAKQVRQAFSGVVRKQLNLNDDQMKRLDATDQRFQKERNAVGRDERDARVALKAALEDTTGTPDQAKVDDYMSRLVKAQHRRADILEGEQKELSGFLTPVQRAKYFALRDQLTRRVSQMRQDGRRGGPPPQ